MNALDKTFSANHFHGKDVLGGNAHNLNDDDIWEKKIFVSLDEIQALIDTSNRLTHSPGPSEIQKLHWSLKWDSCEAGLFSGNQTGSAYNSSVLLFKNDISIE